MTEKSAMKKGGGSFLGKESFSLNGEWIFIKVGLAICILISYNNSVGYKERCEK